MAIMSYQPLDEQLSTQFLNLLGDGGLDPLRPGGTRPGRCVAGPSSKLTHQRSMHCCVLLHMAVRRHVVCSGLK